VNHLAIIKPILRAEIDPTNPVPEAMQVIHCLLANNPGQEKAIIQGIMDGIEVTLKRIEEKAGEKGDKKDGK
jgi:hypothetical protein